MVTDEESRPQLIQALQLDRAGRHDEAIALYAHVLTETPDSFDAHYGMARALDLVGRYEQALEHFGRALRLAPAWSQDQATRMLAVAWVFAGDVAQASRWFIEVFDRRVAASNMAGAAEVAGELGRVHLETGDLDEAETWYRRAHECARRSPDAENWQVDLTDLRWAHAQARIAARRGDVASTRQFVATVRGLLDRGTNPDHERQYAYLRGYVALHLGDDRAAIDELAHAELSDPFVQLLLGYASERLGRLADANEHYRRVLLSTSHAVNSALARPVARAKLAATRGLGPAQE